MAINFTPENNGIQFTPESNSSIQFTPENETSLWEDVKIPLAEAAGAIDTGVTLAGRGLERVVGYDRSIEDEDKLFKAMEERRKALQQWANPEEAKQSFAAKLGGTVATLPAQIAAMPGQAPERMRQMIDMGESASAAQKAGLADTALNMAAVGLPASLGASLPARLASGAALNVGTGAASDVVTQAVAEQEATKKAFDPLDPERRAMEAIIGAGVGGIGGRAAKGAAEKPASIGSKLDVLDKARTEKLALEKEHIAQLEGAKQGELFTPEGEVVERQLDLPLTQEVPAIPASDKTSITPLIANRFRPEQLPTFELKDGTKSVKVEDVLSHIEAMPARAMMEDFTAILPKVREILGLFGDNHGLSVILHNTEKVDAPMGDGKTNSVPGFYQPDKGRIVLGKLGMSDRVFVHELVHGLTVRFTEAFPDHPATKQIQALFDEIKDHPDFKDKYGTTDIHEFMSETFTDPSFKERLLNFESKVLNQFKNAYDVVVDAVSKIFKADTPAEKSALFKALEATHEVAKEYAARKIEVDQVYFDKMRKGILPSQMAMKMDQVTEGAASRAKAVESPPKIVDEHTAKQEVISKTAGMDYIPADPKVTPELMQTIAKEPDGSSTWALTPGALARSELANSTLVKAVYRFSNNAVKRAEHFGRNTIQPVEKTISKLLRSDKDAGLLKDLMMRELARKEDYTPDELRAAGVPDKIILAQAEFRAMMQEALEKQNAALRAKGLKEIKGIEAYYSARWSGPWRANIKDADGKIIWQIAEQSKSLADNAVKYIQARQPDLKYEPVTYRKGRERGDTIEAGYLDMLNLLDKDDPRIQTLKSIYEEYLEGKTDNISNQEKHQLRKTGVRGYAGDRPWSKTDVKDFFVQQFEYAKNASRWAEFQQASEGINKMLSDPSIKDSQPNNIKFSKDYFKNQLGFGTSELFSQIDNSLAKSLGVSPQKLQEYMGAGKTFFYLKVLGLSLPFTITQFLQPAITTPGWHADLNSKGFKHNPILSLIQGLQGGSTAATWHYANGFNNKPVVAMADKLMTPLQREAAQYMEANQVVDINPISDIKRNLRPTAVKAAAAPFEFTIRHSELIARSMAFMSFVSHLEQSGEYNTKTKEDRLNLFQKAEEMTSLSMTDYRSTERAPIFEKGGLTGDAAATLHAYQINNLMQLTKFTKEASQGNVLPLFYMVALQAAAGGMLGMWFVEDLDDMLDNLKKIMPHSQYMKVKDFNLKNWILDNFGDLASFGLASKVSGTNIHTRMNASDQIPIWPFESGAPLDQAMGLVPFSKEIWESGKSGLSLLNPNSTPQERAQDIYQLAPSGFKGALETQPPFTQNGISASPRDLSMGQYRRTEKETDLRAVGLRSPEEAKFMEKKYALSKVERELTDRVQTSSKKATQFFTSGKAEDGVAELIKYTELGGDPMTIINGIPQAQINRVTTEIERRALTASSGTRPAVLKLQRALQFYGNPTNR